MTQDPAIFTKNFNDFLSSITKLDNVVSIGDFNIHVDNSTSSKALEFLTLTETFNFDQHFSGPTHQKAMP